MELTIDHIASEIMCWCSNDANSFNNYWHLQNGWERKALSDIINRFNSEAGNLLVKDGEAVYASSEKTALLFNPNSQNPKKKILAELICENNESSAKYLEKIKEAIWKMDESNLKDEYKNTAKYLISMYHNLEARDFLRENNFIEVFNNLVIGCAIKRIK